jgi:uncharacterized membrane protein
LPGAAFIAWSERFRSHGYAFFSYSLKAVGSGTLYLSLWAAFSLYHLMPAGAAFAAMILVTAFNGFMAWAQDAELLALYAIAGGIATPLLVSTGENHEVTLFTYVLVLDLAVLVLVALRPWSRLLFAAFAGTVMFSPAGRSSLLLERSVCAHNILPRLLLSHLRLCAAASAGGSGRRRAALQLGQPGSGCAAGGQCGPGVHRFYNLFDWFKSDWAGAWLAVGFAAFYLLMLPLPAWGKAAGEPSLALGSASYRRGRLP